MIDVDYGYFLHFRSREDDKPIIQIKLADISDIQDRSGYQEYIYIYSKQFKLKYSS